MADTGYGMQFRPAGIEFSSDEDDENIDNFCFGVPGLDSNKNRTSLVIEVDQRPEDTDTGTLSDTGSSLSNNNTEPRRGGFGIPAGYVPKNLGPCTIAGSENKRDMVQQAQPPTKPANKTSSHTKVTGNQSHPIPLEDFKTAIMRGNIEELQKYLDQGVSVNEVLRTGWTALMHAGNQANVAVMTFLLERGANPNYHTDHYNVLMAVCAASHQDQKAICRCAQLLIDKGVDVNQYDRYHMSSLMYAARHNKGDVVKLLLDAGAQKDKQDSRGYTALAWAACNGHIRVVHVLLDAGADPDKLCCDGSKPEDLAIVSGHEHVSTIIRNFNNKTGDQDIAKHKSLESMEIQNIENEYDIPVSSESSQYGALEMFLLDAELADLISTFQEHRVTFEAFLRFTDNDLQQLGINQLGVRKKLLNTINTTHKQTWEASSLPSIQYNKLVTCPESIGMVVNLGNHASYMATSAGYIADQINSHPQILTEAKDCTMVINLGDKTEEALAKVRVLYKELETLRKVIAKEMSQTNFDAADIVKVHNVKKAKDHRTRRIALVGIGLAIGLVVLKRGVFPQITLHGSS